VKGRKGDLGDGVTGRDGENERLIKKNP